MTVYRERAALVALLAAIYPSWFGSDPKEPDYPVIYVQTEAGQLSWHISRDDMDLFAHVTLINEEPWDGHSTDEKYDRIKNLIKEII